MASRHILENFKKETTPLLEIVTQDIYLESIWLSTMAMLELVAAEYILSNITEKTPAESLRGIIEHVKDEQRHGKLLLEMRPVTIYPDKKYYEIEDEWRKIGLEFIMSFFNGPLLREANHRHAAYVHGAQTIERFPFRIYTLYLSMTKLAKAHELLPGIIADEYEHIELGKKMYAELLSSERMPLTKLYRLEENLCLMMLKRMNLSMRNILNMHKVELDTELELELIKNRDFEIAWNFALSSGERNFSIERSKRLKEANTLLRAPLRTKKEFKKLEKDLESVVSKYIYKSLAAGISENTIQHRFNNHYNRMIYNTNSMALHYAYYCILEESKNSGEISFDELKLEEEMWSELNFDITKVVNNENSLSISWA